MAENDDAPMAPNKRIVFVIAGIGLAFVVYNFLFGDGKDEREKVNTAPVAIERGSDPVNEISSLDRDAALSQFNKKIQALEEKYQESERKRAIEKSEFDTKIREATQKANTESRALADEISTIRANSVENAYQALNQTDKGTVPGDIPDTGLTIDDFDLGSGVAPEASSSSSASFPSNPYGPNYFILNPNRQSFQATPSGGAEISATEQELFNEMQEPDTNAFQKAAVNADNNTTETMDKMYGRDAQRPKNLPADAPVTIDQSGNVVERESYVIPAFSYVEVTTLHGAACPIGANSPNGGNADERNLMARPIVLPVRGVFRGPNGAERDLGNIHLMGLCSGNRNSSSSTGRATIRIEQLSYWDEFGEAQHLPALGYIVDSRDNAQDVYGRLDKANGRTLALQSAAAALAAFATTLSQEEFTNTTTIGLEGQTSAQSTLTGDATKAAIQQGIAASFTKIGERFEREANAMVDTVIVEPGIKLKFITEQPIKVYKAAEPFDIDASRYDVLI